MTKGIFDKKEEVVVSKIKETDEEAIVNNAISSINNISEGGDGSVTSKEEAILDITDEEEEYAEQMLFNKYAEKKVDMKIFKKNSHYITICTNSPQDLSIVDECVFDLIRDNEDDDGNITIPEIEIRNMQSIYKVALSFVGVDGSDVCDNNITAKNKSLKMAIKKLNELLSNGDLDRADSLKKDIKKNLYFRVCKIKEYTIQIMDFIIDETTTFESRMFEIMNKEFIIPKS